MWFCVFVFWVCSIVEELCQISNIFPKIVQVCPLLPISESIGHHHWIPHLKKLPSIYLSMTCMVILLNNALLCWSIQHRNPRQSSSNTKVTPYHTTPRHWYDASKTTDIFRSFLSDQSTFASTPHNDEVAKVWYFTGKVKYNRKVIRASKDLFLMSPEAHQVIPPDFYLNGIILSALWGGC